MAYRELIKNFQHTRAYMRDFYVYGFKSREEFNHKSSRSYDNERRRIESYLGDYMSFAQSIEGKRVFISIDSRSVSNNPLYKALKAKSFTDGDITFHFILFDILYSPEVFLTLGEIIERIDREYLSFFDSPLMLDRSTLRKKLKEYTDMGLVIKDKKGREAAYRRRADYDLSSWQDAVSFFSEIGLNGVIGSYLLDRGGKAQEVFSFKHHYITHALEEEVLFTLLEAMSEGRSVEITIFSRRSRGDKLWRVTPIRIYVSVQTGRRYLLGYNKRLKRMISYRLDYISEVKACEVDPDFNKYRQRLSTMEKNMWGVGCSRKESNLERVEFTIRFEENEEHIYRRLVREKRCGTVERLDDNRARFTAEVYESVELVPWIRTFICRITDIRFSNRTVENQFKKDLEDMYSLYDISGGEC